MLLKHLLVCVYLTTGVCLTCALETSFLNGQLSGCLTSSTTSCSQVDSWWRPWLLPQRRLQEELGWTGLEELGWTGLEELGWTGLEPGTGRVRRSFNSPSATGCLLMSRYLPTVFCETGPEQTLSSRLMAGRLG